MDSHQKAACMMSSMGAEVRGRKSSCREGQKRKHIVQNDKYNFRVVIQHADATDPWHRLTLSSAKEVNSYSVHSFRQNFLFSAQELALHTQQS